MSPIHKLVVSLTGCIVVALAVSCGTEAGSGFLEQDAGTAPCDTVYAGRCGQSCADDAQCTAGLHCANGACTAECAGTADCGGRACSAQGRCAAQGGIQGTNDGGGSGANADACIDLDVPLQRVVPTVLVVVDQSSSMTSTYEGQPRWDGVREALIGDGQGIIEQLQGEVDFGIAFYTAVRSGAEAECPRVRRVEPAANNLVPIEQLYSEAAPLGGTPTGESLDAITGRVNGAFVDGGFARQVTAGPKVLVLATDGDPDTCANGEDGVGGKANALAAVEAGFGEGIHTFVIAVGDDGSLDHQRQLARAGVGQSPTTGTAEPFTTSSQAEFVQALRDIVFGVRSCVFQLGGSVQPGQEGRGRVVLDGTPLTYQDANGWRLNGTSEIELLGTSCDAVKTADGTLEVTFPCGTFSVN